MLVNRFSGLIRVRCVAKYFSSAAYPPNFPKIAVVLSGCGVYDGTEVHEAAACLAAISRKNATPICYAPDQLQAHVIHHLKGEEMSPQEKRNAMIESGRIARGIVEPLCNLKANRVAGVVFPGGFGAAKNLSDFAFKGTSMKVDPEVERILKEFQNTGKPIALCCIAPILAARVFGSHKVRVTLGRKGESEEWPHQEAIDAALNMGAEVIEKDVNEVVVDDTLKIVSSPAFMYNGRYHQIQEGVGNMIEEFMKLVI